MRKPNIIGLGEYEIEDLLEELRQRTDVSRLEIIDHTPCATCDDKGIVVAENYSISGHVCPICRGRKMIGRQLVMWDKNKKVNRSVQDEGRTMKIFVSEREGECYEDVHNEYWPEKDSRRFI